MEKRPLFVWAIFIGCIATTLFLVMIFNRPSAEEKETGLAEPATSRADLLPSNGYDESAEQRAPVTHEEIDRVLGEIQSTLNEDTFSLDEETKSEVMYIEDGGAALEGLGKVYDEFN